MKQADEHNKKDSSSFFLCASLIALPFLYVLSVGPAVWVHNKGYCKDFIEAIYYPVGWLRENTFLQAFLDWYVSFFQRS